VTVYLLLRGGSLNKVDCTQNGRGIPTLICHDNRLQTAPTAPVMPMHRVGSASATLDILHSPITGYFETQQIQAKAPYYHWSLAEVVLTEGKSGVVDVMMMTNFANYPSAVPAGTGLLAGQARVVRGKNLILDSTKDEI